MKRTSQACWLSAVAFAAAAASAAAHAAVPHDCTAPPLRTKLEGINGLTGGTTELSYSVTNAGNVACRLQGQPLVRVPSSPYPVLVETISPDFFSKGASTPFDLRPGETASAAILVGRPCVGDKWMMTAGAVYVGFGTRWSKLPILACKKQGSVIEVGRFQRGG